MAPRTEWKRESDGEQETHSATPELDTLTAALLLLSHQGHRSNKPLNGRVNMYPFMIFLCSCQKESKQQEKKNDLV
jgi:hypothetical protein